MLIFCQNLLSCGQFSVKNRQDFVWSIFLKESSFVWSFFRKKRLSCGIFFAKIILSSLHRTAAAAERGDATPRPPPPPTPPSPVRTPSPPVLSAPPWSPPSAPHSGDRPPHSNRPPPAHPGLFSFSFLLYLYCTVSYDELSRLLTKHNLVRAGHFGTWKYCIYKNFSHSVAQDIV